jgi:hypothetical protein
MNLSVRRRTHFDDMNRANKSRVVFKCEPFTVAPTGDERPVLVRTTRFSQGAQQPAPAAWQHPAAAAQAARVQETIAPSMTDQEVASNTSHTSRNSRGNEQSNGSLSLDSLAQMTPFLDQKSRSDYVDMTSDLGF